MEYYFAPLEGITNFYFRKFHHQYYPGINKYFIPFLNPASCYLTNKDFKEIDPVNNQLSDSKVIPQIISKNAKETLWLIKQLEEKGYDEVNLNFGCPSGTVVAKNKGAGILRDLSAMDSYLKEVFESTNIKISIKIRLGVQSDLEFDAILKILNQYPVYELIVHPRTAKDKYVGPLHMKSLVNLNLKTNIPIIYNGDIRTKEDIDYIKKQFPYLKGIMIGRGLVTVPDLLCFDLTNEERSSRINSFYHELMNTYLTNYGYNNAKYYIKEIWTFLIDYFDVPKDIRKKLFKSEKEADLTYYSDYILTHCPICIYQKEGIQKADELS